MPTGYHIDGIGRTMLLPFKDFTITIGSPGVQAETGPKLLFWWEVTSAAYALAAHLESMKNRLAGARVIELGCGLGLAGIYAGRLGAEVVFTDYSAQALQLTKMNALGNGLTTERTQFIQMDWDHPLDIDDFDILLGSEIIYDYTVHGALIKLIYKLLRPNACVLLADRKRLATSRFIGKMIQVGLECEKFSCTPHITGLPEQEITIYQMGK